MKDFVHFDPPVELFDYEGMDLVGTSGEYTSIINREPFSAFFSIFYPHIKNFKNVQGWRDCSVRFFAENFNLLLLSVALYPPLIYGLKKFMENRPAFHLRVPLILWNLFLATFSAIGALYMVPMVIPSLMVGGWWGSVCTRWCYGDYFGGFYIFLFDLSKVFEFVDTIFIVLRKKPLIFLHYYHHVVTMLYCWYCNQTSQEYGCYGYYFASLNLLVHAVMYSYYAVSAMGFRPPSWVAFIVTTLQITQMFIGGAIVATFATCHRVDDVAVKGGSLLYFSFFCLFAHFFYKRYITPKPVQIQQAKDKMS